jgi:hypothetical protein
MNLHGAAWHLNLPVTNFLREIYIFGYLVLDIVLVIRIISMSKFSIRVNGHQQDYYIEYFVWRKNFPIELLPENHSIL